jgi:hypothetical protein
MDSEEKFDGIISKMKSDQRKRDNASSLYAAVLFCKWHLEETNWSSEEYRLESLKTALNLCREVLDRANGVTS